MKARTILSVALLAVGLFGVPQIPQYRISSELAEPSQEMKTAIGPIVKAVSKMSIQDRLWMKGIYENCAKVVEVDGLVEPKTIVTTEGLRAVHVAVLKYIWKGIAENEPGKYPELSAAIDETFNSVIADDVRPMTPELRRKSVELFRAIAWAGLGKDS